MFHGEESKRKFVDFTHKCNFHRRFRTNPPPFAFPPRITNLNSPIIIRNERELSRSAYNETPYTHVKYRCERTVLLHHTHPTPAPRASSATHPLVLTFCPADSVPTVLHGKRIFHSKPRPIVILSENSPGDKRGARSEQGRRKGGGSSRRKRSLGRFFRSRDGTIVSIPKVPRQMNIIRAGRSAWLACSGSLCTLITTKRRVSSRAWTRIEGHNRLTGYAAAALD